MPEILKNISLKSFNTFGIDAKTKYFFKYTSESDIKYLLKNGILTNDNNLILGGGSNILFTKRFDGLIIHPVNRFINIIGENDNYVFAEAGAGVVWDSFVEWSVNKGLGGVENLSGIPGTVGASPVQNIGAYGTEAKDSIHQVKVINLSDGTSKVLTNSECRFGYRDSIFKNEIKGEFIVHSVTYKLSKKPDLSMEYGRIKDELPHKDNISIKDIRETIIKIRNSKLPDPEIIGNGGSFFKNPVIESRKAEELIKKYPEIPTYEAENNKKKIAAGWLIDKCGLKGFTLPNKKAGVHDKQALVIINKGDASAQDIISVADIVKNKVASTFGITLIPEVIYI